MPAASRAGISGPVAGSAGPARPGSVAQLAVTPDSRRFAVASFDGSTTLFDLRTLERIGEKFPVTPGVIPVIAFDAHLRRVACRAAGRDITREEWADLLPGRPYRPVCG